MNRTMNRTMLAASLFLCLAANSLATSATHYHVVDLGAVPGYPNPFPSRIYNNGIVLGTAYDSAFLQRLGVVWTRHGAPTTLLPPSGFTLSSVGGQSPRGDVAGTSEAYGGPFGLIDQATVWESGHPRLLGPTPGFSSFANDILPNGSVLGQLDFQPALWPRRGSVSILPVDSTTPYGGVIRANERGEMIGFTYDDNFFQIAHFWDRRGLPITIGTLHPFENSAANDINAGGQVVGTSGSSAFLWQKGRGMVELPPLGPNSTLTQANGINEHGQIVGSSIPDFGFFTSAVMWEDGRIVDLNTRIDSSPLNWFLSTANGISDRGEICGFGTTFVDGVFAYHAYLLVPAD